jgi:hypothetical protein
MNKVKVEIDPTGDFKGIKPSRLLEATGLLPMFAADVAMSTPESVQEAFDMLMECYGFGMGQDGSGWGTVDDKGMYVSEHDDPDMAPMVKFGLTDEIDFLVYQYAICAVTDGTTTLMMRMD